MFITPVVDAKGPNATYSRKAQATNEFTVDAYSWESFSINCYKGDTLSGEFRIEKNTELFPGDQTEYDNWLLSGIDFFVFDEGNYSSWVESSSSYPLLARLGIEELTWSVDIPYNGVWYIVYSNDSIFMKEIEGSIIRSGVYDQFILVLTLLGIATLLSFTFVLWRKK